MSATFVSGFTPVADGVPGSVNRSGKTGELIVGDAHGRYFEAVSRGRCFYACNQAAITFGTALTSTAVTFSLHNQIGSGIYVVILHCGVTMITSTTAGSLVYAATVLPATQTLTTTLTARNALIGGGQAALATACSATTLAATPVAIRTFGSGFTTNANAFQHDNVDGGIILAPGTSVCIQGITIVGTGLVDMLWEEVPIT